MDSQNVDDSPQKKIESITPSDERLNCAEILEGPKKNVIEFKTNQEAENGIPVEEILVKRAIQPEIDFSKNDLIFVTDDFKNWPRPFLLSNGSYVTAKEASETACNFFMLYELTAEGGYRKKRRLPIKRAAKDAGGHETWLKTTKVG